MQSLRSAHALLLLAVVTGFGAETARAEEARSTASIMRDVYDAIAYLLPLSLRDDVNESAWDRELIARKLSVLTSGSAALKAHTSGGEEELRYLARSFDEMAADVHKAYSNEWPEFAYFAMMDLVQHCVACHSRLEAPSQVLFGQRLIARMDTREMPPADVARLYVATRQFDAALKTLRGLLMDPAMHPIEADYTSLMLDYLQIAIAAKRSPATAERMLEEYLARGDSPYYLKRRFGVWLTALDRFRADIERDADFERAHAIFHEADELSRGPGNRVRAVHDITSASIIRRFLADGGKRSADELHEAYYILGVIALRTLEPKSAVPEMELLLASSIEANPDGKHALEAFALIEEYGYVHEEHLADDDAAQTLVDMAGLRALLEHRL